MSDPGIGAVGGAKLPPAAASDLQINTKQNEQKASEEKQDAVVTENSEAVPRELYGTGEQVNVSA